MANIFYGIPSVNNVSRNIDKWIGIAGAPDVFSEKNENLDKYASPLLGKYDVVSLDDALMKYPDADVWVTYRRAGNTAKALLNILPPEKIHFFEADLEYRRGCSYLGYFISYRKDTFSPCCVTGRCPVVRTSGSVQERLNQWQEYTENLVDDIRHGRPNKCDTCHLLKYGFWRKTVKLREVSFGSNNPGDVCNFKCTYCFSMKSLQRLGDDKDGFTTYEVIRQLSEIPEYDTEDFIIQLSNGEFTANRHCEEMLDILLNTKWKISLVTNLSIYREKLATLMETGRIIKLLVSLDAGTRETFKSIKRNDMFEKVVDNLRKYPVDKAQLMLKYIFLENVNDNETDIDGFYEVVKEVGAPIVLSSNQQLDFAPFTKKMRELSLRIIGKAKTDGIRVSSNSSYLNPLDAKFISDSYENYKQNDNINWDRIAKKGNCIINIDPTARIEINGKLELNERLPQGSTAECTVSLLPNSLVSVSGNFRFRKNTDVRVGRNAQLVLGSGFLNVGSRIRADKSITIGRGVIISWDCLITDNDGHSLLDENGNITNEPKPIVIGNHVWIGQGCAILKGVTIGDGAVVAAHSVVTKDVPPRSLVAGNPARMVRENVKWE